MRRLWITSACLIGPLVLGGAMALAQENARQRSDDSSPPAPPSREGSQLSGPQAPEFIADFDDDGDGALARNELPPRLRKQFDRLNRNGDDKLTRRELEQHRRQAQRRPMAPIEFIYVWVSDADQGHLSKNELQRAYDTLQKIDKNGDGELARAELRTCRKSNTAKWARMVAKRLDENDDDQVSQDEAQGSFLAARFDEIDSNGDGAINREELQKCVMQQHDESDSRSHDTRTGRRPERDQNASDDS